MGGNGEAVMMMNGESTTGGLRDGDRCVVRQGFVRSMDDELSESSVL